MSRATPPPPPVDQRIEDIDVSAEMERSFLEYAYSVIYARALPDARDGLKPVQRRILFTMSEMGLRPDRAHVKSARVVGEVMGKLHPHGDAAIYDALVRMAQDFSLRVPLIDGHGNFGSLDDGPAAPRYTEARMAAAAIALTEHLDENVVDFVPNYDNSQLQPEVLPAAIPNLLVNGASGIAVGMATNMAPHNLIEVAHAARHLLLNPDASLDELMDFVPGPDFPSGGTITGLAGVRDAYATGRGMFRTRAKVVVEQLTARKTGLVVTELPYLVGPEKVIEKIKDGVNSKRLTGISDVTDLTDRKRGLRLVIGIKTGFNPSAVLEELYRVTPLEDSFSINNVALVDGQPRTLGLRELLDVFLKHRVDVVTRRSRYRLARRVERLHLVDGLLIAVLDIDEVIQVIRTSDDADEARGRLRSVFDLSELQADYILELRLRRLTKFSRVELEHEKAALVAEIAELEALLASPEKLRGVVATELDRVAEAYGTPRRTLLTEAKLQPPASRRAATAQLELVDAPCRVFLSASGRLARVDRADGDEQIAIVAPPRRSKHDAVRSRIDTTTRAEIGAVTNRGRLIRCSALDLPALPGNSVQLSAGVRAHEYLALSDRSERVLGLVSLTSEQPIVVGTAQGVVKRVSPGAYPNKPDFDLITLKPGDEVVGVSQGGDDDVLVFIADDAQLLRFPASTVRPQGVAAGGMAGISLAAGARVLAFAALSPAQVETAVVATVAATSDTLLGADPGAAKVSDFTEFPAKGRATGGVRAQRFLKGQDALSVAWVGPAPALAVGADGAPRVLPDSGAKRDASGTPLDGVVAAIGEQIH